MVDQSIVRRVVAQTTTVVEGIQPDQWDLQSPCDDWKVRDVVNHITGGGRIFATAAETGSVPDELLGEIITTDQLGDDPVGAWRASAQRAEAALTAPGIEGKVMRLPFGEMPGAAVQQLTVFDLTVHAWDIAKATGQVDKLDPEILGIALETGRAIMPPEYRMPGMFEAEVAVGDDAPVADRLAAFAGRTP